MEYREYDLHVGRRERLRLRIRLHGIESLKDYEIIEFLLYYAVPRVDMNKQAHALIDHFGSVGGVLRAETKELMSCGISKNTAEWLCLLGDTMLDIRSIRSCDNVYIRDLYSALIYGCGLYRKMPSPGSVQVCLDKRGRVIYQREITPSRSWGEPAVLREALNDMISTNAKYALILQFTGSEIPEPEQYDIDSAKRYSDALEASRCKLNDVVLIGDSGSASLRRLEKLPQTEDAHMRSYRGSRLHETPDETKIGITDYLNMTEAQRKSLNDMMHIPEID